MSEVAVPEDARALVAIDLGAESCRVSLLRWVDGAPKIDLVRRFANAPIEIDGALHWGMERILRELEIGLRECATIAVEGVRSIAVDGWAVDYVRLDASGRAVAEPFSYRDVRTLAAEKILHERISASRMRAITGNQIQSLNTVYQMVADTAEMRAMPWLNLPEYVLRWLGGRGVSEYTNATHTQMIDLETGGWSAEILKAAALDARTMPAIVQPGTDVGTVQGELKKLSAFAETRLIAPACHDTASAIAGIPDGGDDWAYISSGTWSLVGTLLKEPDNSDAARGENFTNLGAAGGRTCFHKNVNGMWLLRQCMESWERKWSVEELIAAAELEKAPVMLLDVEDSELQLAGRMPERINSQLAARGGKPVEGEAAMAALIFYSLAARYAEVLRGISAITGKRFAKLYIVGGGSRNRFLNELTARATGLTVIAGAAESSTVGNFSVQLAALDGRPDAKTIGEWARRLQ